MSVSKPIQDLLTIWMELQPRKGKRPRLGLRRLQQRTQQGMVLKVFLDRKLASELDYIARNSTYNLAATAN
jgi:hypothetical protein